MRHNNAWRKKRRIKKRLRAQAVARKIVARLTEPPPLAIRIDWSFPRRIRILTEDR